MSHQHTARPRPTRAQLRMLRGLAASAKLARLGIPVLGIHTHTGRVCITAGLPPGIRLHAHGIDINPPEPRP